MFRAISVVLAVGLLAVTACGPSEEQQMEKEEERQKGFHCLSAWDGNHDGFEDLVRPQLLDPDSMETFETRVAPNEGGRHRIIMNFGARNAFGGMVRFIAFGDYDTKPARRPSTRLSKIPPFQTETLPTRSGARLASRGDPDPPDSSGRRASCRSGANRRC